MPGDFFGPHSVLDFDWAWLKSHDDFVVDESFWTYFPPKVVIPIYVTILYFGPKFWANKQAYTLKPVWLVHNFGLSIFSGALAFALLAETVQFLGHEDGWAFRVMCDPHNETQRGRIVWYYYLFFLSKVYELGESVLLVVRKKKLSLLHWWHHISTFFMVYWWMMDNAAMKMPNVFMNLFVHWIMYGYYGMSLLGYSFWWKRHLTKLQIIQFLLMLSTLVYWMWHGWMAKYRPESGVERCGGSKRSIALAFAGVLAILGLFAEFYISTYKKIRRRLSSSAGSAPRAAKKSTKKTK